MRPSWITEKERNWAMAAHLSTLCLYLGLPLANILFPYLILRWQRNASKFVAGHALAAVNFQITITMAGLFTLLLVVAAFYVAAMLTRPGAELQTTGEEFAADLP